MAKKDKEDIERSSVNDTMVKATGSVIKGEAPGTQKALSSVYFDGLGDLSSFPKLEDGDSEEGVGEYCVVLCDYLSGPDGGYTRGQVRRISKLVAGYENIKDNPEQVKANIRRLFEAGAIRQATMAEEGQDTVPVNVMESSEVQAERIARIQAERKLKEGQTGTVPAKSDTSKKDDTSEDDSWDTGE